MYEALPVQADGAPIGPPGPLRPHCVVAAASVLNDHVGDVSLPGLTGLAVIFTSGGVVSNAYVSDAGDPVFPTESVARTVKT